MYSFVADLLWVAAPPSSGSAWAACPKTVNGPPLRVVSTQFALQFVTAVTAPPLVGCVIWSRRDIVSVLFQDNDGSKVEQPRISETRIEQILQPFYKPAKMADLFTDYASKDDDFLQVVSTKECLIGHSIGPICKPNLNQ